MNPEAISYILLALLLTWIIKTVYDGYAASIKPPSMICTTCGTQANPATSNKGSGLIELILWLCFILPGLIYSIWRRSKLTPTCPACHHASMVPITSPIGQSLAARLKKST